MRSSSVGTAALLLSAAPVSSFMTASCPSSILHRRGQTGGAPQAKSLVLCLSGTTAWETKGESESLPILAKAEDIMSPKAHGTSDKPVQKDLKFGMDFETADRICNFNRRFAEYKGYGTNFFNFLEREAAKGECKPTKFYDSVTGNLLFTAPIGRTTQDFVSESKEHGWPSFRDEEVNWKYVRCLEGPEEECVSITGTHLGHNIPDDKGNRYCINLVSIAGRPIDA